MDMRTELMRVVNLLIKDEDHVDASLHSRGLCSLTLGLRGLDTNTVITKVRMKRGLRANGASCRKRLHAQDYFDELLPLVDVDEGPVI